MLNDNAKKWVAALRSGKYKQSKFSLRTDEGYCCLGVLCDLYAADEWKREPGREFFVFLGNDQTLPKVVLEWVGLQDPDGYFTQAFKNRHSLTSLNDNGADFQTIAEIIESEPERLFVK